MLLSRFVGPCSWGLSQAWPGARVSPNPSQVLAKSQSTSQAIPLTTSYLSQPPFDFFLGMCVQLVLQNAGPKKKVGKLLHVVRIPVHTAPSHSLQTIFWAASSQTGAAYSISLGSYGISTREARNATSRNAMPRQFSVEIGGSALGWHGPRHIPGGPGGRLNLRRRHEDHWSTPPEAQSPASSHALAVSTSYAVCMLTCSR